MVRKHKDSIFFSAHQPSTINHQRATVSAQLAAHRESPRSCKAFFPRHRDKPRDSPNRQGLTSR